MSIRYPIRPSVKLTRAGGDLHNRWFPRMITVMIILLGLQNCTNLPVASPAANAPQAPPAPEPPRQTVTDAASTALIQLGQNALASQRLTTPLENSAYTYFTEALQITPDHPLATEGLVQIVDQYLTWSLEAIASGRYQEANRFLERAAFVQPKSADVAAAAEQLKLKRQQNVVTEILPTWVLEHGKSTNPTPLPDQAVSQYFATLAARIDQVKANIIIYSHSDAEGRWLYQNVNRKTTQRLRANLKIDTPSRIELHFLPNQHTLDR